MRGFVFKMDTYYLNDYFNDTFLNFTIIINFRMEKNIKGFKI